MEEPSSTRARPSVFRGTGYRLGDSDDAPIDVVSAGSVDEEVKQVQSPQGSNVLLNYPSILLPCCMLALYAGHVKNFAVTVIILCYINVHILYRGGARRGTLGGHTHWWGAQ